MDQTCEYYFCKVKEVCKFFCAVKTASDYFQWPLTQACFGEGAGGRIATACGATGFLRTMVCAFTYMVAAKMNIDNAADFKLVFMF